jgi:dynein heavy chain
VPANGNIYVFGGHGGVGFSRKSFNDMHYFSIANQEWSQPIAAKGNTPKERGGHTACLLPDGYKILIYGGWSGTTQYFNCYIFDTANEEWIDLDSPTDIPRWNHCAVIVPCLPQSKMFVFGGERAHYEEGEVRQFGILDNNVSFLELSKDLKGKKFHTVDINEQMEDTKPLPRENSVLIYDKIDQKLLIFGGWSGNYLNDLWELNVSKITGPDYSINSITPSLGPVTGGTQCEITGEGFTSNKFYKIQFSTGKPGQLPIEVPARLITNSQGGPNRLACETPSFMEYGKGDVEVRIIADKGDPTLDCRKFSFFLNISAKYTVAFGPGILPFNSTHAPTHFFVQAKNKNNENRTSGKDLIDVKITYEYQEEEINDKEEKIITTKQAEVPVDEIKDYDNGLYRITYQMKENKELQIEVSTKGEEGTIQKIRGAPFTAKFDSEYPESYNKFANENTYLYYKWRLFDINDRFESTKAGISQSEQGQGSGAAFETDVKALLSIKRNILQMKSERDANILELEVIKEALANLQKEKLAHGSEVEHSGALIHHIEKLADKADKADQTIAPSMAKQKEATKAEIEKFEKKLKDFYLGLRKKQIYDYGTGYERALVDIKELQEEIGQFNQTLQDFSYYSAMLFEEDETPAGLGSAYKNYENICTEIEVMKQLWDHIERCEKRCADLLNIEWKDVDPGVISDEIKNQMLKPLNNIKKIDKKSNMAYKDFLKKLKQWEAFMGLIAELRKPAMQVEDDRHWNDVRAVLNEDFAIEESLKLDTFWNLEIYDNKIKEQIEEITVRAFQEGRIETQLEAVDKKWKNVLFERMPLQLKEVNLEVLRMNDDDVERLENDQLLIQNISASKFQAHFSDTVKFWQTGLAAINDTVTLLAEVQKTWSFLINLFRYSEEVKKELDQETKDFHLVDKEVEKLLSISKKKDMSNVLNFCTQDYDDDTVLAKLNHIAKELAKCQKGLNNFIARKRKVFPRFYFLTMEELLDILANGNNPVMLFKEKNYMSKVVQAADKLSMEVQGNERPTIVSMNASVGKETVKFVPDPKAKLMDKVELYLQDILNIIWKTMRESSKSTYKEYVSNVMKEVAKDGDKASDAKLKWVESNYAQLVLLISATGWVKMTEENFRKIQEGETEAMSNFFKTVVLNLNALIRLVQGHLESPTRKKVMCMITMETHNRDIIEKLVKDKVRKADEFQWQSQLKFYYDDKTELFYTRIADAKLMYGYEYLGNGARLVVTPLTDRIYVTATQALHLKMGCAPAGPAGTGKTETTKDLASAVAKACYVFNCSPEMNYESMGNIFKGLAASGCWGCFDEFNRLVPEVLSVCTVQFKAVTDAIKANKEVFDMGEDTIKLDPTCGAFITMNPGYLGRSELPEGLKALFRPITVVVPDLELICENILMAEGFVTAKTLARKFVTLYKLCRDLLSKQDHYDWGLRAIKSVLVVAGSFKRGEPDLPEGDLLFRALRDFNYPKIAQVDLDIFDGLLGDLFPGLSPPRKVDVKFEEFIKEVSLADNLKDDENFTLKVVQLGELLEIRHCVFIMGNPGAGKTTTWKILAKANTKAGNKTTTQDMDPKTVSTRDLYGYTNMTTKEWKNGLLSHYMQYFSEETVDGKPKWIILDGDLDANWIESMNSVMDDNKLLTLANNGRIVVKDYMRLIFEIRDLKFATPATVSRAGILYISDDKGYQRSAFFESWLKTKKFEENMTNAINDLFEKYIEKTVSFLYKKCKFVTPVSFFGMTVAFTKLLQSQINIHMKHLYPAEERERPKTLNVVKLEHIFALSAVWAFGGCLTVKDTRDYRKEFSDWWKGEFNKPVKFKPKGTVFDYFVKMDETKAEFEEWKVFLTRNDKEQAEKPAAQNPALQNIVGVPNPFENVTASVEYDGTVPMQNITVPIPETISIKLITKSLMYEGHPTMMIGNAGSGKTQLIKGLLKEIRSASKPPNDYYYVTINFNYFTDAVYLQTMLEQELVKQGTKYGPKKGSQVKLIYFIDDLNMPQLDLYNTQSAIALLRQHVDHSHWYDISKAIPILKEITNTLVIAAMNPTSGSFSVNPRYQRHFWTCSISFPEAGSLSIIYETFLKGHFSRFKTSIQELIPQLIKGALSLHDKVSSQFRKTAVNFHYEFNIRHISNIFSGILQTQPNNFVDTEKVIKLWFHESERIYADRLVEAAHIKAYTESALDVVKKVFGKNVVQKHYQGDHPEPLVFCHFPNGYLNDEVYDLSPFDAVTRNVKEALVDHNSEKVEMNLVLFEDAIKHVCKISRIITNTAGHALLVGVGGSGKQSLSKLAAFIKNYNVFSITVSKEYSMTDLKTDLQDLYNKTGVKDDAIMFLITDSHITQETFLVYINDLLSSGEIADLYTEDERVNITNTLATKYRGASQDEIYGFFIDKVREKLHVVLCFSPIGDAFRTRARRFPALVNSTVIDWFHPWPESALEDVSKNFLQDIYLGEEEVRKNIVKFMPFSFNVVNKAAKSVFEKERRYIYNTPKSFLELIKLYKSMLGSKRKSLQDDKDNYEKGLTKLIKTKNEVNILEQSLILKQVEVDQMKSEADKVAEVVGKEKEIVEEQNKNAKVKKDICAKIKAEVEKQQTSCQADVDRLQPMVDKALEKVKNLQPESFKVIRGFNTPPAGVDKVFNCIQFMFANIPGYTENIELTKQKLPKNVDWAGVKKEILTKADVLIKNLQKFPEEIANANVPDQNFVEISKFFQDPNFNEAKIFTISKEAGTVFVFVSNMVDYYNAMKDMIPKQNSLKQAQITLTEKVTELAEVEALVKDLNEKLAIKQKELDEATAKKDAAQAEADACNKKLSLARRLVSALDSEEKRWATSIDDLSAKLNVLVGDVLISASFISYAGPFSKQFRTSIINTDFKAYATKRAIPMSKDLNPMTLLVNDAQIAEWNNEGLPADDVSIENGTILTNSERYPLMIDPQLQGITWIKERFKKDENSDKEGDELMILKLSKKNYTFDLERAVEDGQPVLIENLGEYIDPVIMPVIARNVIKKGNRKFLIFGGKQLDLHPNFRLYMQTKLSNPNYPPEVQAEAVLINFTVTEVGLGDQLLNFIVGKERPDLAAKKKELILQQNKYKILLKDLERGLLDKLNKTVGDPTENIELIEGLEYSKKLASEIKEKVTIAQETTEKINETSEFYRQSATRGALIFFLMNDLYKMSSFYMYSLESFINVIDRALNLVAKKYQEDKKKAREQMMKEKSEAKLPEVTPEGEETNADAKKEGEDGAAPAEPQKEKSVTKEPEENSKVKIEGDLENLSPGKEEPDQPLTPRSLKKRVADITESITYCAFSFVRRGLFEKHKLIFTTMLCFKIMISTKDLKFDDYQNFIIPKKPLNVNYPENENIKSYVTEAQYKECKGLEYIEKYQGICDSLLSEHITWKTWISKEKVEDEDLPSKNFIGVTPFQKLMLIKILRPDRVSYALKAFLIQQMGLQYTEQPAFKFNEVFEESNKNSPIFFVLFPGVDPTPSVEAFGAKLGYSTGTNYMNISMGQGQEDVAKHQLEKSAKEGGWIFLQNVHLMESWLKDLELKLEELCPTAHENFRVFISSEPPPPMLPTMKIIPEAILQRCIKVSNEAPADLKANMRRAYAHFSQEKINKSSKQNEYKSILFALCYFHAVVSGRKKFGNQGWSRIYNFNDGDLTICADVLNNYLEKYEVVPYSDLIYIYGEIMYGGHITDDWDRRTNNTYLKKLISPKLLNQENLLPVETKVFRMLDPAKSNYEEYKNYIEKMPDESPLMFGMHPNAEINFLMNQTEFIFQCIIDLIGESGGGAGKSDSFLKESVLRLKKETEPQTFDLLDLRDRILALNKGEPATPFQIVCMQECERMNQLTGVMVTTLIELELGLDGALNMTDAMDNLAQCLTLNRVPPSWGSFYMSRKPLDSWFQDFKRRCDQLREWTAPALLLPKPLRLSYLFNPMSFLTAIMQITARENGLPLDNMALVTKVTSFKDAAELTAFEKKPPPEKKKDDDDEDPDAKKKDEGGAYVDGFFLEGADWENSGSGEGYLTDQKLKTLHPILPIIKVIAVPIEHKSMKGQYPCPVYYTTMRGPTYIFTANLTMENEDETEEWKWILAGCAAILNDDN